MENNFVHFIINTSLSASFSQLQLSNNQLSHLPAGVFQSLDLRELHLANNSLASLPASLLEGQLGLEILDLSGNILMSAGLPTNLTQDLPNLLELDLPSTVRWRTTSRRRSACRPRQST